MLRVCGTLCNKTPDFYEKLISCYEYNIEKTINKPLFYFVVKFLLIRENSRKRY